MNNPPINTARDAAMASLESQLQKIKSSLQRHKRDALEALCLADKLQHLKKREKADTDLRECRLKLFDAEDAVSRCFEFEVVSYFAPYVNLYPMCGCIIKAQFK